MVYFMEHGIIKTKYTLEYLQFYVSKLLSKNNSYLNILAKIL